MAPDLCRELRQPAAFEPHQQTGNRGRFSAVRGHLVAQDCEGQPRMEVELVEQELIAHMYAG